LNRLQDENALAKFYPYHLESTAQVKPYILQLQQAMLAICSIVEAIDRQALAQNGRKVFGIDLPTEE